ncbi:MAG TPA: GNVR domain-containing protein [Gemmatimonadaceae bacterium]|nr:GNVR domain-containing protein [Gemmatimonadaceae bacterium]
MSHSGTVCTAPGEQAARIEGPREGTSLLFFLTILLRNRNLIAVCSLIGVVAFGIFAFSEASLYVANGAFAARGSRTSTVPGAAQIGLTLGVIDIAQSTMFYAELARSNSVLIPVAASNYTVTTEKGTKSGPLATFKGVKGSTPLAAATIVAKGLPDQVTVLTSGRSGVVTLLVSDKDPQIAAQIAMNILRELDSYSSSSRKAQAVAERKFVEELLGESRVKLTDAEARLSRFREQNREYFSSPQLKIQDDQLSRDVDLAQQNYAGLEASYQQARIEEVRDLSAIRIVEYPDVPVVPQRKEAARKTLIGLIVGLLAGIVIAFMRQRAEEKRRARDDSLTAFEDARREATAYAHRAAGPLARSSAEP